MEWHKLISQNTLSVTNRKLVANLENIKISIHIMSVCYWNNNKLNFLPSYSLTFLTPHNLSIKSFITKEFVSFLTHMAKNMVKDSLVTIRHNITCFWSLNESIYQKNKIKVRMQILKHKPIKW